MRNVTILLLALAACTRADQQASDMPDTGAPGAAALMASDVSGSWTGTTMAEGSDSVVGRWTTTQVTDSTSIVVFEGSPDTVRSRVTFEADSMIVASDPYTARALPGSPQVRFRSIGRLSAGRLVGTSTLMLAANQDSVIRRSRWEASRAP
ncbi:MAG TPA: hypothetical protein VMM18_12230 [Gemmatimonadaceae bacterium]|nr:hypothetical protein [Gemmatimonadaceae bacterium]